MNHNDAMDVAHEAMMEAQHIHGQTSGATTTVRAYLEARHYDECDCGTTISSICDRHAAYVLLAGFGEVGA